mmetsp:Transcript_71411/g.115808  ORF Transcript_71411/g.115808 Transcript_71411/m.115808 type:complete len:665 (+) Transcript_71411:399-2393(+)
MSQRAATPGVEGRDFPAAAGAPKSPNGTSGGMSTHSHGNGSGQYTTGNGSGGGGGGGGGKRSDLSDATKNCHDQAKNASFVHNTGLGGMGGTGGLGGKAFVDWEDPKIKEEVLRMIASYLQEEGYVASSMMLMDEANLRRSEVKKAEYDQHQWSKKVKKAIIDGDWVEVEKFCNKSSIKSMKNFLYCVYKQQYLELVDRQEYQKAFTYLTKKLKQYEKTRSDPEEFKDLCYLLTCRSISDVDKDWDNITAARQRLAAMFNSLLADSEVPAETDSAGDRDPWHTESDPSGRLLKLIEQAVEYQIRSSSYQPIVRPPATSLLRDYHCFVLPNALRREYKGHSSNVKSITFMNNNPSCLVSGSSDQTLRIWNVSQPDDSAASSLILRGHTSRIWDLSTAATSDLIASASGDASIKIWNVESYLPSLMMEPQSEQSEVEATATLVGHKGDVYACSFHPERDTVLASAGYDKTVRLWDVETLKETRTFYGHTGSVTSLAYSAQGNLIISGSKDNSVRFWDIVSGLLVNSMDNVGEVTSLDISSSNGYHLLTASKGNSNRLWDLRKISSGGSSKALRLYKGNQNTFTNFIRVALGPCPTLVMSGSEDGYCYLWDRMSGCRVQRLGGYNSIIYSATWSQRHSLIATSSHDGIVRTWWYDEKLPIEFGAHPH